MFLNQKVYRCYHPYHIVDCSAHPILVSLGLMNTLQVFVLHYLHSWERPKVEWRYFWFLRICLPVWCPWHHMPLHPCWGFIWYVILLTAIFGWFYTINVEAVVFGKHNEKVRKGLMLGFILFLCSEVMLFFAFFWAYVHSAINPSPEIGGVWPPYGVIVMPTGGIPWLATFCLLFSWYTLNIAEKFLAEERNLDGVFDWLGVTMGFGVNFLILQWREYTSYNYGITDSIYGSVFYFGTGLHGLHVILGLILLGITLSGLVMGEITPFKNLFFRIAVLYWHFVDAVWIALLAVFYIWGHNLNPHNKIIPD